MNKTLIVIFVIVVILGIVYFIFRDRINKYLGINKSGDGPEWVSCKKTFFVKLPDGRTQSINTADVGTVDSPMWKYYKKDVGFSEDGLTNIGASIEITEQEFNGFCKYIFHPPYAWYTEKPPVVSPGH